jgi:prolipoprotein diacylglyceryltransferase
MDVASFPLGPFIISVGGLIAFAGILVAALVLIRTVRDEDISLQFLNDHLFLFIIVPFALGRIGAFTSMWASIKLQLSENIFISIGEIFRSFFLIENGGIRSDWAIGGFFVIFFLLSFLRKQKKFAWLDAFILPGILILAFVSLGGYFSGWGYGKPSPEWLPFPFSIEYNLQEVRYSVPLYAVQLYTAFFSFLSFFIGWRLWRKKIWQQWPAGKFFAIMILITGLTNGLLEYFRGDTVPMPFDVRLPQIFYFFVIFLSLLFLLFRKEKPLLERLKQRIKNF